MAFTCSGGQPKNRDQITAIDLGGRSTKAVHLNRKADGLALQAFTIVDAPIFEKTLSPELLGEHLKAVNQALGNRSKQIVIVVGIADALLRQAELTVFPVEDMRLMLKYNSKNYLQQDLPDYIFDCQVISAEAPKPGAAQKCKVLVGGAKKQYLADLQAGAKLAGLVAASVAPSQIGVINAFELAQPEAFANDVVALVDLGFKNSSICILNKGEIGLNRVVGLGGDKLTQSLAEILSISYAEAEGIKVGLPEDVQAAMQSLLMPLGRELRASIDFFEHQADKTVSQVFMSGSASRSNFIVETLQGELMVQCKTWNPTSFLKIELSPQQVSEIEQAAPLLTIAVGGAISVL